MSKRRGTRARAEEVLATALEPEAPPKSGIKRLCVVRESDASDTLLFEDMIYKTISEFAVFAPELNALIDAKLEPITNPRKWDAAVTKRRSGKSCQFIVGETLMLYHLGSAKHVDYDEDLNFFTEVILEAIERFNPPELLAFHVTRLVRDEINSKRIETLLLERGTVVRAGGTVIDFGQPHASMVWTAMASAAAQERSAIVERNRLGRIATARRNNWPHGKDVVPPGYMLVDGTLQPNPEDRERIGKALLAIADPNLSNRQMVERLGALGITRTRIRELHGKEATVADVLHPRDIRQSFIRYLSLYEHGVYEMPLPNPSPNATTFGGLPVHGVGARGPSDLGFVVLRYEFGVPDGDGWAAPEVFEAIRARSQVDGVFRTGQRENVRPFGGRRVYKIEERAFQVDSNSAAGYRVIEHQPTDRGTARVTLATIKASSLHKTIADAVVTALSSAIGVTGELVPGAVKYVESPEHRMTRTIEFHSTRAARAREEVLRAADEGTAAAFRGEAEREEQLAKRAIERSRETIPELPHEIAVDPTLLMSALAAIAKCDRAVPALTALAIQELIPRLEIFPDRQSGTQLSARIWVRIPTLANDVIELGPIEFAVEHQSRRLSRSRSRSIASLVLREFAEGRSPTEIAAGLDLVDAGKVTRSLQLALADAGVSPGLARGVAKTPIRELRVVMGSAAESGLIPTLMQSLDSLGELEQIATGQLPVASDTDPLWAALVLQTYLSPLAESRRPWSKATLRGQRVIDIVEQAGGTVLYRDLGPLAATHFVDSSAIYRTFMGPNAETVLLVPVDEWKRIGRKVHDPDNGVALVPCLYCGASMTCYLRVRELPASLLCRACNRSNTSAAVFPASYLELPRGFIHLNCDGEADVARARTAPKPAATPPKSLSKQDEEAILRDYRDLSIPVVGSEGVVQRHGITMMVLYALVERTGTTPRRPFRPRS